MPRKANPYLRVTSVLSFVDSEWIKYWWKSVGIDEADRVSRESAEFGTGVHKVIEAYLNKENGLADKPSEKPLTERQLTQGQLLIKWCKEARVQPLNIGGKPAIELPLKSEKYKLTGHPDLVATFGDGRIPFLIDWKSSSKMRSSYPLQLAAYAKMIQEEYGVIIDDGAIVRVVADPNLVPQFETHEVHNLLSKYWPIFEHCLEVVKYFKGREEWKGHLK